MNRKKITKEFNKIWKKANGEQNIVGDLIIKDFIFDLLYQQREEILKELERETIIIAKGPIDSEDLKKQL